MKKCESEEDRKEDVSKLLEMEIALIKQREKVAEARRALPWVKVKKDYKLQDKNGKDISFNELFRGSPTGDLIVVYLMFKPGAPHPCPMCSYVHYYVYTLYFIFSAVFVFCIVLFCFCVFMIFFMFLDCYYL